MRILMAMTLLACPSSKDESAATPADADVDADADTDADADADTDTDTAVADTADTGDTGDTGPACAPVDFEATFVPGLLYDTGDLWDTADPIPFGWEGVVYTTEAEWLARLDGEPDPIPGVDFDTHDVMLHFGRKAPCPFFTPASACFDGTEVKVDMDYPCTICGIGPVPFAWVMVVEKTDGAEVTTDPELLDSGAPAFDWDACDTGL